MANAYVVAIEPDPTARAHLQRNIELNALDKRVDVQPVAVGAAEGSVSFTVGLDTMNQVVAEPSDGASTRIVPVQRLDALLGNRAPVLIKLDVEGYEAEALAGAEATLACPSLLAIESEGRSKEVLRIMHRHGFEEVHYDPFRRSLVSAPAWPQSNALFIRGKQRVIERVVAARPVRVLGHTL